MNQEQLNEALRQACKAGDIKEAKKYIKKGADVDYADENGYTPFHIVAINGYTDIAKLLLAKGANPKAENVWQTTPLHLAAGYGRTEIVKLLEEAMKEAA